MSQQRIYNWLTRPIFTGALSYVASRLLNPEVSNSNVILPLVGVNVSPHTYFAIVGWAGSGSVETLKAWVLPYLPQPAQAGIIEGAVLGPVVHGGLNVVATNLLYPTLAQDIGNMRLFAVAGLAELGADYFFQNFVNPLTK